MSAGETFNDEIDREARAAKAVLVCWSPDARDSRWVKAEAMIGFEQDKLVACYVAGPDGFLPPAPFNTSHTEDLRAWLSSPSDAHPGWKSVLRRVGKLCGRSDIESWGALAARPGLTELRAWLAAHVASPLFTSVEALLRAREAKDAERARQDEEAHARRASEEANRRAREEAGRKVGQEEAKKALRVVLPASILAGIALLASIAILSSQQAPSAVRPEVWPSYEGIRLGWSRDEVLARRGSPQLVLGPTGSGGEGVLHPYAVDETAWPFELRQGQTKSDFMMPEGTTLNDYPSWYYTAGQNNGHDVYVSFDQGSDVVGLVSCDVRFPGQATTSRQCAPLRGVRVGDTEEQIIASLGHPTSTSSHGNYRVVRYDPLGVTYGLEEGRTVFLAASRRPLSTQPDEGQASDSSPGDARAGSNEAVASPATEEGHSIPSNCEGLSLPSQEDAVVTQIERPGATIVYTGRPVQYSSEFLSKRYVVYRDLGLAVGDPFCGYFHDGRRRIAGDSTE